MNQEQIQFCNKLIKSLYFGLNQTLSIVDIDSFFKEVIPYLKEPRRDEVELLIKYPNGQRAWLGVILAKCALAYGDKLSFDTRLKFLEIILERDIKLWVCLLFSDLLQDTRNLTRRKAFQNGGLLGVRTASS